MHPALFRALSGVVVLFALVASTASAQSNLLANGTFETNLDGWAGYKSQNGAIVQAPEMLARETTDTHGTGGALRLTVSREPQSEYYSHVHGAGFSLTSSVPQYSVLRIQFYAKSLSGSPWLSVARYWGHGITHVQVTSTWQQHTVYLRVDHEAQGFVFGIVPGPSDNLQALADGSVLLDDIVVTLGNPGDANMAVNGSLESALAPWAGVKFKDGAVVDSPEMVERQPAFAETMTFGLLRLKIERQAGFEYYSHNSGASCLLTRTVPAGSTVRVRFKARSVSGSPWLSISRPWGAGGKNVQITPAWQTHQAYFVVQHDTPSLMFGFVPGDSDNLQAMVNGEALIDDVDVRIVDSECGDGIVEEPEVCEPELTHGCKEDCTGFLPCGNGVLDAGEACDPGLDARCSAECTATNSLLPCDGALGCTVGQVCGVGYGVRYGSEYSNVCVPSSCTGPAASTQCGDRYSPCGECVCEPDCRTAQCGQTTPNGCGGICANICGPLASGCARDEDCQPDYACGIGVGDLFGRASGTNVCWPRECTEFSVRLEGCGQTSSHCGQCPEKPNDCGDRECGEDRFGHSCGTCGAVETCDEEGQCRAPLAFAGVPEPVPAPPALVGTLPGSVAVTPSGTATYRIPLTAPPGRAGLTPALALVYNSGTGLSPLGYGWSLEGLSTITRCPKTFAQDRAPAGIRMDATDQFCLDGQRLVAVSGTYGAHGTEYRTEVDSFVRVTSFGSGSWGPGWWEVRTKSGRHMVYGFSFQARQTQIRPERRSDRDWQYLPVVSRTDPRRRSGVIDVAWNVESIEDLSRNRIEINYENSPFNNGTTYQSIPSSISYGHNGSHKVVFTESAARTNLGDIYRGGVTIPRATRALSEISFEIDGQKKYHYALRGDTVGQVRRLRGVTQCADVPTENQCLPETTFNYGHPAEAEDRLRHVTVTTDRAGRIDDSSASWGKALMPPDSGVFSRYPVHVFDFDGDGRDDVLHLSVIATGDKRVDNYTLKLGRALPTSGSWFQSASAALPSSVNLKDCPEIAPFQYDHFREAELLLGCGRQGDSSNLIMARLDSAARPGQAALVRSGLQPGRSLVDVNGDGRTDVVLGNGSSWMENNGETFLAPKAIAWLGTPSARIRWSLVLDYDGDGVRNLVAFDGDGKTFAVDMVDGRPVRRQIPSTSDLPNENSANLRVTDVNADGLDDVVSTGKEKDAQLTIYLSDGAGFRAGVKTQVITGAKAQYSVIFDVDRDGFPEMLVPFHNGTSRGYREVRLYPFPEAGKRFRVQDSALPYEFFTDRSSYGYQHALTGDFDGDGAQEILLRKTDSSGDIRNPVWDKWEGPSDWANKLTVVVNGLGQKTALTYDRGQVAATTCDYPHACPPKAPYAVVSSVHETASTGLYRDLAAPANTQFELFRRYLNRGFRSDLRGRGALGFDNRTIFDNEGNEGGVRLLARQRDEEYDPHSTVGTLYYAAGKPTRVYEHSWVRPSTPFDNLASMYRTEYRHRHMVSAAGRPFFITDLKSVYTTLPDPVTTGPRPPSAPPETSTTFSFDHHGNLRSALTSWIDGRFEAQSTTYLNETDTQRWNAMSQKGLVGLPLAVETWGGVENGPGALKSSTVRYDYDSLGRRKSVQQDLGDRNLPEWSLTLGYDDWGNQDTRTRTVRGGPALTETDVYDDQRHLYLVARRNSVHQGFGEEKVGVDPVTGAILFTKAIDGSGTSYTRDVFGRVHHAESSSGGMVDLTYSAGSTAGVAYQVASSEPGLPTTVTEYNQLAQPVRVLTTFWSKGPATSTTVQEFGYDTHGLLRTRGVPHFTNAPSSGSIRYRYDLSRRLVSEVRPRVTESGADGEAETKHEWFDQVTIWDASFSAHPDAFFAHRVTDPSGAVTTEFVNRRGNTLATVDAHNTTTKFDREIFDHLRSVDVAGVATTFQYDALGRLRQEVSPDRGTTTLVPDGLGRVTHQNRNGDSSDFEYDALGRLISRTESDRSYVNVYDRRAEDTSLVNVGKLVKSSVLAGGTSQESTFSYQGPGAQLDTITRKIDGETYVSRWTHDGLGRPDTLTYPGPFADQTPAPADTFAIKYTYNGYGLVDSIGRVLNGSSTPEELWRRDSVDPFGGVEGSTTLGVIGKVVAWEKYSGMPREDRLSVPSQGVLRDVYKYDARGLAASYEHLGYSSPVANVYGHDALARMELEPASSEAPVYPYDLRGNLLETQREGALHYTDTLHPHRVRSTSGGQSYDYDKHGRMDLRTGAGILAERQKITYTSFDLPSRVINGSDAAPVQDVRFTYDAEDRRVTKQVVNGNRTTYVGDLFRRVRGPDGDRHVFTVPLPDGTFIEARRVGGITTYYSLQTDRLGTVRSEFTKAGQRRERSYDLWGTPLSNTTGTTIGFTGHEHDTELGLINMRGRMYDPGIGRFLTPDPIVQAPGNAQSWNRYSYVFNSPANFADPSGYASCSPAEQRQPGGCTAIDADDHRVDGKTPPSDKPSGPGGGGGGTPTSNPAESGGGSGVAEPPRGIGAERAGEIFAADRALSAAQAGYAAATGANAASNGGSTASAESAQDEWLTAGPGPKVIQLAVKGFKVIKEVSYDDAVKAVRDGWDVLASSRREAKQIARDADPLKRRPSHDKLGRPEFHPGRKGTQAPDWDARHHFHVHGRPESWGHVFYNVVFGILDANSDGKLTGDDVLEHLNPGFIPLSQNSPEV